MQSKNVQKTKGRKRTDIELVYQKLNNIEPKEPPKHFYNLASISILLAKDQYIASKLKHVNKNIN